MTAKPYGMVHSHAVLTARLMLERCDVEYEARDIMPGLHAPVVRAAGFPRWTVPALLIDGRRLQGTLTISRELDRLCPAAGLFPRGVDARRAVEAAERWGHDELQELARRVFRWAGAHSNAVRSWMAREVVGLPAPAAFGMAFMPVMVFYSRRVSGADDATVRADLARLPGLLDRADTMLEAGTIGAAPPKRRRPADLQRAAPAARPRRPSAPIGAMALRAGRTGAAAGLSALGTRRAIAGSCGAARGMAGTTP